MYAEESSEQSAVFLFVGSFKNSGIYSALFGCYFEQCLVVNVDIQASKGVIAALESSKRKVHMVIRLTGTNEEEGQRLLEEAGIPFEISMEEAAKKAVELCEELKAQEASK